MHIIIFSEIINYLHMYKYVVYINILWYIIGTLTWVSIRALNWNLFSAKYNKVYRLPTIAVIADYGSQFDGSPV